MDREKVIKGLEHCSIQNDVGCQGCPYFESRKKYGHEWCTTEMAQDALALLKDDETRIQYLKDHIAMCKEEIERLKEQEAVKPVKQIEST